MFKASPVRGNRFAWLFFYHWGSLLSKPLDRRGFQTGYTTVFSGSLVGFTPCRVSLLESQHPWQTGTLLVWPASGPKETNAGRVRCSEQAPFPAPTRAAAYHSHVLSKLPCPKSLQVMGELETSVMCHWVKRKNPSPTVGWGLKIK